MFRHIPFLATLMALAAPATAEIISVTASPSRIIVGEDGRNNIVVRYRVRSRSSVGSTLFSPNAELVFDGNSSVSIGGPFSAAASPGSGIVTHTFSETIDIDDGVAADIFGSGGRAFISRTFDDGTQRAVTIGVQVSGNNASATSDISNLAIYFDDRSQLRSVLQSSPLRAQAVLTVQGRGILTGSWQIDEPGRAGGFRTLQRVRKPFAGSRKLSFDSPALPTRRAGTYRVRFVPDLLTENKVQEDWGTLLYTVIPEGGIAGFGGLSAQGPGPGAPVSTATPFSWTPTANAAGYQVEFTTSPGGALGDPASRVAAISLPPGASQTRLRPFTLSRIANAGGQVYWRVVALDGQGLPVASSQFQPLGRVQ